MEHGNNLLTFVESEETGQPDGLVDKLLAGSLLLYKPQVTDRSSTLSVRMNLTKVLRKVLVEAAPSFMNFLWLPSVVQVLSPNQFFEWCEDEGGETVWRMV